MQYHLNGYRTGAPEVKPAAELADTDPTQVDVLIIGCGPAGLTLAAQLAALTKIKTRIVERKSGPLTVGQADGIACRSMEMFEAFGFAHKVRHEAYWVNETAFWRPSEEGEGLSRTGRIKDVEDGLSEQPHTILNQARVHDFYLEVMQNAPTRLTPSYNRTLTGLARDDTAEYPITARLEVNDGAQMTVEHVRARYVIGCDGARSAVRKLIGLTLEGASARQLWGVMDVLATTDFPDIRLKCAIQSAASGSLLIIPREGGYMVRMYIELDELSGEERAADRNVSSETLISKAQAIFAPYRLDVKDVVWWSAYEIGQRVCARFDDNPEDPRIFIAGDACHNHSPKAGQGMNVSMADAFNLGWKLAAVIDKRAHPALLRTYSVERQAKAKELIDFDREMAQRFSAAPDAGVFQQYFSKHARYTAGVETQYDPSVIIGDAVHQTLATGFAVGTRFHSAPVIRLADAKPIHLGHTIEADGRWRLFLFAAQDDDGQPGGQIAKLAEYLWDDPSSPILRYTPKGADKDAVIDVRAVFQQHHQTLALDQMPLLLRPEKGRFDLIDTEKVFCPDDSANDIFEMRGINRERGAMILLRPDQYVAQVLPLAAHQELGALLSRIFIEV
ncbi:MAG: FAD-dependent monooxygenase [Sulfitobacter sp.]